MNHLPRIFHLSEIVKHVDKSIHFSPVLAETASLEGKAVFSRMKSAPEGLSGAEAARRLAEVGPNVVTESKHRGWPWRLFIAMRNPLVILLIVLSTISFLTDDVDGGTVMALMVVLGVLLRFVQEARADAAADKLKAMINVSATVVRDGNSSASPSQPGSILSVMEARAHSEQALRFPSASDTYRGVLSRVKKAA